MTDIVERLNAALQGRYAIERELGEGGMATVYLADDLKHERRVALKVLKPELAAVVGADRFLAEIKTTANLQHPHILPLFDSGEADGFLFYVMPYVEGESLRDRLDRDKQLPIQEAVRIASDVAEALHAAHLQGVIHRDIKPANILLSNGRPLVADFGIALAVNAAGGGRLTETGLSMGTPYYMSPEQATADRTPGAASDVYSLGCVLYEMLVGDPPHTASSAQAVLSKILTEEARAPAAIRRATPPNVDAAVRKAIEKLPADRFGSADEFAKAMADPGFSHGSHTPVGSAANGGGRLWNRLSVTTTALAGVLALVAAWGWLPTSDAPAPTVIRARIDHAAGVDVAISADGRVLAFLETGRGLGRERPVFVRGVDELVSRRVPAAVGASALELSPNGDWLAFSRADSILKVDLVDGTVLPVTGGVAVGSGFRRSARELTWTRSGDLWFVAGYALWTVPGSGGTPVRIYPPDDGGGRGLVVGGRPLPSGERVLLTETDASLAETEVLALDLASGTTVPLLPRGCSPRLLATGNLVYENDGTLFAVDFDEASMEIAGDPTAVMAIADGCRRGFDVSETGTLVYRPELTKGGTLGIHLVDTLGVGEPLPIEVPDVRGIRFSPDGRRIAYGAESQVWVFDPALGTRVQISTESGFDPVWSRGGDSLTYHANTETTLEWDGFRRAADGSGTPEQLFALDVVAAPQIWLKDGRLMARGPFPGRLTDLFLVDFEGDSVAATPFLRGDWNEDHPALSPDERWIAYVSTQSGEPGVFVRPMDDASVPSVRVSNGPAGEPAWHPRGDRLYFWENADLVQVTVRADDRFEELGRRVLFSDPEYIPSLGGLWANYDIHPDGDRFVIARRTGGETVEPYTVLVANWFEELRGRMGGGG
jgi:Tol biopolymer transport system component/tRNA A-37 threonylcarbamoyl transferase component Bud32